ncbi:lipoprotein release ABC transporter permease [Thermus thermophilus]|nr:lipoprotein release ABC transporter permease [Thermus thermophilus]
MELFLLVLRNLLARPVRSLLTLLGVLVATASMVLFLSFGEGLRRALFQELSRVGPAIQVVPEGAEGFVFGGLPEISPETLKALERAGEALGVRAVVPTLFLTRGGFDPSTSFLFQGLPEGTPRTSSTRGSRPGKAASSPRKGAPWWGPRWPSGAASPWEAS